MKVFIRITAERGSLSGYFGPADLIQQALSDVLRPASEGYRGRRKGFHPSEDSGFRSAHDLVNYMHSDQKPDETGPLNTIRYVRVPSSPVRDLPPGTPVTIVCEKRFDLNAMYPFSGLTIIEDGVLIPVLKEEEPEEIGIYLRNLAVRTGGIIVIGKEWVEPVRDLEPWFDRVGWMYEQPMSGLGKSRIPDYGQSML